MKTLIFLTEFPLFEAQIVISQIIYNIDTKLLIFHNFLWKLIYKGAFITTFIIVCEL
jgi:hypothetical protein